MAEARVIIRIVRVRWLFASIVLTICVGAPILEMFDQWDHTLQDGNDTEANLVVVVLCVGVGFIAAASLLRRVRPSWIATFLRPLASCLPSTERRPVPLILPGSSPPTTLRI